ncbi:hypothetical protein CesoFtcFv8_009961 [Champsocephalus esox]|uniref:Uncharacterized protein n=1 Tax=Champsocephalus esox TaxID=159716 RepID=A0AAN8GZ85_9TELE|nr:hypothetical protein CesoFtcFv8_009961 [Champsocephalus esox]
MDGGPCLRVSQCNVQQFRRCLQTRATLDSKNKTERTSGNKLEKILQELIESHGGGADGGPPSQFSEAWRGQLLLSTTMEEHGSN